MLTANLRKAAILIRSLDTDTAATLLAQLSPTEARSVRMEIQSLGTLDPDEQADVASEFRRVGAVANEDPRAGVELKVSAAAVDRAAKLPEVRAAGKPFEFLEQARIESLVPYLSREHGQTVAVVLSYLAPKRAAQVLAALPARLQSEVVSRLSTLGDTDPNTLHVLERELADWVARQQASRLPGKPHSNAVTAILSATTESARQTILTNLLKHNRQLAAELAPIFPGGSKSEPIAAPPIADSGLQFTDWELPHESISRDTPRAPRGETQVMRTQIQFDELARMDQAALLSVLQALDAEVLVLALAGANDALVERIAGQMPRKIAKSFRERLRRLGPTRLRDVEAAQVEVAAVAAKTIAAARAHVNAVVG